MVSVMAPFSGLPASNNNNNNSLNANNTFFNESDHRQAAAVYYHHQPSSYQANIPSFPNSNNSYSDGATWFHMRLHMHQASAAQCVSKGESGGNQHSSHIPHDNPRQRNNFSSSNVQSSQSTTSSTTTTSSLSNVVSSSSPASSGDVNINSSSQKSSSMRKRRSCEAVPSGENKRLKPLDPSRGNGNAPFVRYPSAASDDLRRPLFVDCSVEYDLTNMQKVKSDTDRNANNIADTKGHQHQRLLIIHPGWRRQRQQQQQQQQKQRRQFYFHGTGGSAPVVYSQPRYNKSTCTTTSSSSFCRLCSHLQHHHHHHLRPLTESQHLPFYGEFDPSSQIVPPPAGKWIFRP